MASWEAQPPGMYEIVTGFFPEANPQNGQPDHRPLLVCGVARKNGRFAVRVAYGTKKIEKARPGDIVLANLSILNSLHLKYPTCFVINRPSQFVILPWTSEFFKPWSTMTTPILGVLPVEAQRDAAIVLCGFAGKLPQF